MALLPKKEFEKMLAFVEIALAIQKGICYLYSS
jgi:hypothetical protein